MSETVCDRGGKDKMQSFLHESDSCRRTGPEGMDIAANHLLCRANDALDGDGGGEDGSYILV